MYLFIIFFYLLSDVQSYGFVFCSFIFYLIHILCIQFSCSLTRKYKPLHMQSMTFPTLWYSGRFSPFESPPPQFEKRAEQGETKARFVKLPFFQFPPLFYHTNSLGSSLFPALHLCKNHGTGNKLKSLLESWFNAVNDVSLWFILLQGEEKS